MSERQDFGAITAAFATAWERQRLFAGALSLIRNGVVVCSATAGVERDTRFEIGSITKMLTAVAMTRSGVDLDTPVSSLVAGFGFDDPRGRAVTTRHLLSHTSGLPAAGRDFGPNDPGALRRFATTDLAHHRFHATPGEVACYSSTALSLAGLVLQEQAGSPFPDLMQRLVLAPAGMPGAGYPGRALREAVSWPHHRVGDDWVPVDRLADNAAGYPSGFLLASIEDMTQFALHMIHGTLLSGGPLALATTRSPRWTEHASSALARASSHYGLGVFTGEWSGQTVLRHGGSQLTSNCSIDFFPGSDSAIVLLTNGADDDTFVRLLDLCYRALAGSPGESPLTEPVVAEPASIGGLTGTFLNVDTGAHVVIETGHGGPTLVKDTVRMPLRFLGDDRWLGDRPGGPLPVGIPTSAGRTEHVVVWGGLYQRIDVEDRRWEPERLVGVYADSFWDEPDTRLTVEIEDDSITVSGGGHVSSGRWLGTGLISDHGLIELDPDGSSLTLGRATRYRRVG